MVGSPYATDILEASVVFAFAFSLRLGGGGAVQKGKERRPGKKKIEGEGRWIPVLVNKDGPWIMVATSVGISEDDGRLVLNLRADE